jgi:holin-like protein
MSMEVLRGFGILLLCQSAGELMTRGLDLPLPGPVIGMLILLLTLNLKAAREPVAASANALLGHLSLLFVPVGVGVIAHLGLVAQHGWQLLIVIIVSTTIGLAATAWVLGRMWGGSNCDGAPRHCWSRRWREAVQPLAVPCCWAGCLD